MPPLVLYVLQLTASPVAIDAFSHAITNLTKAGRFRQAADREKEIAQIYLNELGDTQKACESYERAAEWYQQEDATAYVALYYPGLALCQCSGTLRPRFISLEANLVTELRTAASRRLLTYMRNSKFTPKLSTTMKWWRMLPCCQPSPSTALKSTGCELVFVQSRRE